MRVNFLFTYSWKTLSLDLVCEKEHSSYSVRCHSSFFKLYLSNRRVSQLLLFPHLNLSKKNKNLSKTWETVSCYIVFEMLCTFGNPTFLNGVSQLPYHGYVANRTIKTMLETVALQKKKKTFTMFTITFQTPKLILFTQFPSAEQQPAGNQTEVS